VSALVSIGGWTGSIYYSTAVGSAQNRTAFVKAVVGLVQKYKLDGIDFEYVFPSLRFSSIINNISSLSWEYPGKPGIGCNTMSTSDSANFLSFLRELRKDPVGSKLRLTAAVGLTPFLGSDGTPMSDVSQFASVLDHIGGCTCFVFNSYSLL